MLRRLLITSAFVLLGSIAAFAQSGTANCPADQKQVTKETTTESGLRLDSVIEAGTKVRETVREVSCEPKEKPPRDNSKGGSSGGNGRSGGGGNRSSGRNGGGGW
jgi:hypothetical protein